MTKMWYGRVGVPLVLACFILTGCSDTFSPDGEAGYSAGDGATAGGVQDMQFVHELIADGRVPPPEAFTVEGMFSEHDLALTGTQSNQILNLRGATGVAPNLYDAPRGWLQVGLSSNVVLEEIQRPNLSFIACVDASGSMGWTDDTAPIGHPAPVTVVRELLTRLTDELTNQDRCGIVTYGTGVSVLLHPTAGDSPHIDEAITGLTARGATNMEAGLQQAIYMAHQELDAGTDEVRIFLFTDVQPNVGATDAESFRNMTAAAAEQGISLTVFGIGVGMQQAVMNVISDLRGGNAFSLFDTDDVDTLVDDQWPWLTCPIARDLTLHLDVPGNVAVAAAYGFPGQTGAEPELSVATIFPSRRHGALLVELQPYGPEFPTDLSIGGVLSYTDPTGTLVEQSLTWGFADVSGAPDTCWYSQCAVGRTVALTVLVDGMRQAAEIYGSDQTAAVAIMEAVCSRIDYDTQDCCIAELEPERRLAHGLRRLMCAGAEQGDLYGTSW